MRPLTVILAILSAHLGAGQSSGNPDPRANLPFTSVVSGPWYPGTPPFQSLSGTKVYARGGRIRLGNRTTASVECNGSGRCTTETVFFVNSQTGHAYLNAESPQNFELFIHPTLFYLGYTTNGRVPRGALTGNFIRVGDNPDGRTTSPPSCEECSENQAPALFGWPIQSYVNGFYACPDNARNTSYTLYEKIIYYSPSPPNNCNFVTLAALNWKGNNPAVESYD